jgi:hypothetical protein
MDLLKSLKIRGPKPWKRHRKMTIKPRSWSKKLKTLSLR